MPQGKGTYGSKVGRPPKKKMNVGGMMPTQEQKINPTTGMTMNKGGMSKTGHMDMRKTGMFYGGMAKKKK